MQSRQGPVSCRWLSKHARRRFISRSLTTARVYRTNWQLASSNPTSRANARGQALDYGSQSASLQSITDHFDSVRRVKRAGEERPFTFLQASRLSESGGLNA